MSFCDVSDVKEPCFFCCGLLEVLFRGLGSVFLVWGGFAFRVIGRVFEV